MAAAGIAGGAMMSAIDTHPHPFPPLEGKRMRPTLTLDEVWRVLARVPDPEIPAISVVDLGIVRDVEIRSGEIVVTVTPTYSGCPATEVIAADIERAL